MAKTPPKELRIWDWATDRLVEAFIEKYFDDPSSVFWVGNDNDKDVLAVNDYFFSLERIVDALRYNATPKQLFDYCDLELEAREKELKVNFRNYIKNGNIKNWCFNTRKNSRK